MKRITLQMTPCAFGMVIHGETPAPEEEVVEEVTSLWFLYTLLKLWQSARVTRMVMLHGCAVKLSSNPSAPVSNTSSLWGDVTTLERADMGVKGSWLEIEREAEVDDDMGGSASRGVRGAVTSALTSKGSSSATRDGSSLNGLSPWKGSSRRLSCARMTSPATSTTSELCSHVTEVMLIATSSLPTWFVCIETVVVCVGDVIVATVCDVWMMFVKVRGSVRRLGFWGGLMEAVRCVGGVYLSSIGGDDVITASTDVITSSTNDSCWGRGASGELDLLEAVDQWSCAHNNNMTSRHAVRQTTTYKA